jgi:hypothetical protein
MVQQAGVGVPTNCSEPVVWVGNHRLSGGKQIRVWSCEGHREGVEEAERVDPPVNGFGGRVWHREAIEE